MPIPISLGKFNKRVTNRLMIRRANHPPFSAIRHRGRTTGREYRIPLNAFPRRDEVVFALTYGSGADWVKNVLADGRRPLSTVEKSLNWKIHGSSVGPTQSTPYPVTCGVATKLIGVTEYLVVGRS